MYESLSLLKSQMQWLQKEMSELAHRYVSMVEKWRNPKNTEESIAFLQEESNLLQEYALLMKQNHIIRTRIEQMDEYA